MILIDATTAQHARGVRTVIEGVVSGLGGDSDGVLVAAGAQLTTPAGVRTRRLGLAHTRTGRLLYQRLLLPLDAAIQRNVDRVLLLDSYVPLLRPQSSLRYAALIHDVLPLTHPRYWPWHKRIVKRTAFGSLRHSGSALFASSEHNAAAIRTLIGRNARVVRFGCGQLSDEDADRALSSPLPPQQPHLVYVGAFEPRKNLFTLLEAFELVAPNLPDHRLVLVGDGHPMYVRALERRIEQSAARERIEMRRHASRNETLELIAGAGALIFPSLAEGFGLPVLEALALGTPVVASDVAEIRCWADGVVSFASPHDATSWRAPIIEAVASSPERRRAGQSHAKDYRWQPCAQALIDF